MLWRPRKGFVSGAGQGKQRFLWGLVKDKTFCFRVFRRRERFVFGDVQVVLERIRIVFAYFRRRHRHRHNIVMIIFSVIVDRSIKKVSKKYLLFRN